MITFTPIHKRIQKTLYQKIDMLTKNTDLFSIGSNITKKDSDGSLLGIPNENYMMARSTWTRATSFVPIEVNRPIILMGGELNSAGNMASAFSTAANHGMHLGLAGGSFSEYDMFHDRGGKYSRSSGEGGGEMPYRPMPGIKDISIEYKGGGMTLGATRTSEINWTCWTWEELDRLQQHFLAHGKTVFLEWGWTGVNNKLMLSKPYPLFKKDDDGFLIFDMKEVGRDDTGKTLSDKISPYILKQNGHYDAMLGVIQDFTWSVRDDGGFDCVTTLVSPGMNALQKQFKSSGDDNISTLPLLVESKEGGSASDVYGGSAIQTTNTLSDLVKEKKWEGTTKVSVLESLVTTEKNAGGGTSPTPEQRRGRDLMLATDTDLPNADFQKFAPYINFKNYMADLPSQLESNWYYNKNTRESGTIIVIGRSNQFRMDGKIVYPGRYYHKATQNDRVSTSEMYCTWGWFEDNVLSRFFGHITVDGKVQGIFRSLDYKYDEETGEVIKELKNEEGEVIDTAFPQSVKIRSTEKLYTVDTQKWLLIQDDVLSGKFKENVNYKHPLEDDENDPLAWRFSPTEKESGSSPKIQKEISKYGVCNEDEGFIRNVYFHGMYLANKMMEANTMESAIMSVWNDFAAAYGGVHQFKIEFEDDGNHIVIRDTGQQGNAVVNLIEQGKNNRRNQDTGEDGDMNGLFEFPIWENGSIVKSQNLSAKLPSRMQMAAMYGSQNVDTSKNKSQRTNDVLAGEAWGKLFSPNKEGDDGKTLDEIKKKRYKDLVGGDVDFPSKHNRSFGRADANPITNLHVGAGEPGEIESPIDGTIVYPSIFNEMFAGQAQELQKRIKSSLEGEDIKDDRAWYEKMFDAGSKEAGTATAAATKVSEAKKKWTRDFGGKDESSLDMYMYESQQEASIGKNSAGVSWGTIKMKPEFSAIMKSYFRGDVKGITNKTDPIIPVELEMEVDGTGGIFPGNAFQSSYLPQRYREICCFQVKGASHTIDSTGWTTTLAGQLRVGLREVETKDSGPLTAAQIKANIEAHNRAVKLLKEKRRILANPLTGTISGEENFQIIKKFDKSLTEEVVKTPEEIKEIERQNAMIDYQDLGDGNVNQYEVRKDALIGIIHDEDSQWEEGNLTNIANFIDGKESIGTSNTGLGFLQYMSDNHEDRSIFPQYWSWDDEAEIELAYQNWVTAGGNSIPTGTGGD